MSSLLRSGFGLKTEDSGTDAFIDQATANGMGSLRRGWEAGRIGNELNPLYTEELEAGIAGDEPKRLSLRNRIDSLKQKQGMYAPEVGRVEDIDGVGSALSWGAGQVGQGVASMADPMAVSAGLNTVGRIAGAIPNPIAKGVGYAAQGAGMLIPALMSKQQLTGEFIGNAEQDAELMARTSPQALRDAAGNYGTLAAIPDSFLPGMVGRQVSGLSRAGSAVARQGAMGAGTKTLLGMGMEGGTETLQSAGSQYAQGLLNPDRDTSGDFMENVNSFAGGAVGAGPFAAAGAYAEAGHNRIDGGVDAVKGAAGDVVDLLNQNPTVQAGVDGAKKLWGSAKDKTIDIMSGDDGKVSAKALVENLKQAGADLKSTGQTMMDERDVLMDMPPEDILADNAKATAWMSANAPKRAQLVADKLDAMEGDEQALAMRDAMDNPDPTAQQQAVDAAAEYVLSRTPVGRAAERANSLGESVGKIAGVVGPAIGKGIVATAKAAVGFGKSIVSGAQDGMRKKNEQTSEPEGFMAWRDRYYGVTGQAIADKTVADADPVVTQRADLAGNYVGDMARRLNKKAPNLELLARHAAFSLADIVMQTNAKGLGDKSVKLNRLADDLHGAFATETPEVLAQLASIMGPKAAPVFQYLEKEVAARMDKSGFKNQVALRDALASQVVALVDPEAQNNLLKQGVNLNTPRGREQLLGIMEDYADGIGSASGMRKALENTFGAESVQNILTLLNGATQEKEADVLVDDRKQTGLGSTGEADANDEELSDFDKRAEEKNFAKGAGPKVYGFSKAPNLRTNSEKRDMFGAMDDADSSGAAKRPQLFEKGQKLFGGEDAIAKKIADVKAQLASDPEYAKESAPGAGDQHDAYRVTAKSAHDVMTEANMQPGKVLQLYRDYLQMDGNIEEAAKMGTLLKSVVQAKTGAATTNIKERAARKARAQAWSEENPGKTVEDYKATVAAERTAALAGPVAEATKAAKEYFSSRYLVVGEQLSNQDPGQITLPEILNLHKEGTAALSKAKLDDSQSGEQTQQATSDANVLMFIDAKNPDKRFSIPAGKLVNWVRQQRGKAEQTSAEDTSGSFSNASKDEAYLADVNEGIATLIGSGYVKGMPYKLNKFGKTESFNSGVPESLRLATKTYGEMKFATKSRREKRRARSNAELATVGNEDYDAEVAADQNRNADFFTPDDRADRELVTEGIAGVRSKRRSGKNDTREAAAATDEGGDLVTREAGRGTSTKIRVDVSGQVVADAKTDDPSATQMDFDRPQRDGVPDDYANQRWLSRQTGASTDASPGPEPKGTAASSAEFRASKITDAFINDQPAGQEMIRSRIRSAMRPEYTENKPGRDAEGRTKFTVPGVAGKDQVVGGVHYIAPVAYFISAENIGKNNLDMLPATINAIQSKVANILLKGEVSKTEKVKMARLMFRGTDTNVHSMNVDAVLGRLAAGPVQGKAVAAKQEAAPGVANAGLPKGVATQSGGRKLNAMAVAIHTDLERGGFAATHDSPIRHEGKFDWRKHTGKGEGNASFGAGTYLSTAEGVHKSYKNQFTATVGANTPQFNVLQDKVMDARIKLSDLDYELKEADISSDVSNWVGKQEDGGMIYRRKDGTPMPMFMSDGDGFVGWSSNHGVPLGRSYPTLQAAIAAKYNDKVWSALRRERGEAAAEVGKAEAVMAEYLKKEGAANSPTYEVSVDIKPEQLLDWNAPLNEQSELVQKALAEEGYVVSDEPPPLVWKEKTHPSRGTTRLFADDGNHSAFNIEAGGDGRFHLETAGPDGWEPEGSFGSLEEAKQYAAEHRDGGERLTGEAIYENIVNVYGSQAKASDYLQSLGILGHKYNSEAGRNDVHPNYVIYDDAKITTNYVHFNQQGGNARTATQADMDAAKNYALKVLGPKIKVDFKDITGYSGEFIDAQNVIEISTTAAAGTMGTLYHEAMHVFFRDFVKGNPRVQAVFESLVNDPKHIAKLHSLLDGFPAAQAQLTSGEERLAYTYQFWKAGLLQVDTTAHTWLQKIGKFFRTVLGRVRDSERALELFQAFDNGKMSEPSAAGQVIAAAMNKGSNALKLRRQADGLIQRVAALTIPAAEILGKSLSPTARKLSTMMFTNPGDEEHGSQEIGMMNARRNVAQQYTNVSNRRFETMSEVDKAAVQKALQSGIDPVYIADAEQRAAVKDIRQLLDRFHKYMTDAGMKIGKIDNYYPVVWNANLLNDNRKEFIDMLATKYADQMGAKDPYKAAERIWRSLVDKEGVDAHLPVGRDDGVLSPFFASQEQRTLPWLDAADREKYLDKNMPLTLTRYFAQGAHATEYYRRFGKNGVRLEKMLADINVELSGVSREMMKRGEIKDEPARVKWVARQMRDVTQSTGAMEGSLGKDVSPSMRTFNSWMAVYQNIRLLPMALFSSFVDPLALVARGAPLQAAYETFVYSMREVFRGWADAFKDMPPERQKDEWRQLSEHVGASEIAMFQHHVSDEYSSTYMTAGAKKLNDKMFTFNGMEAWNRGSRIMATKWAVRFIEKHSALPDKNHSERWLKELGLQPSQIVMDDGKLVTSPQQLAVLKGITLDDARQRMEPIHNAINRWVEGAVLTPNAAQRPAWSSDPNYASFFHLKQFAYSFHQTILKRAVNEFSNGNIAPLGALALFIPTMIGADIMKGLIQGAGTLPPYMAGMNAGDWMMHGVQRAGLAGIGVIGVDAGADWASLGGPAFEQIIDAARDGFGSKSALKAMPVNALYGQLVT